MKKLYQGKTRQSSLFKFDLKMKLAVSFLFLSFFGLQANTVYPQKTVTFDLDKVKVSRLLDIIELQTDFRFVYIIKDVDLDRKLNLKTKKEEVPAVLDKIFKGTQTEYKIFGNQIFLVEKENLVLSQAIITIPIEQQTIIVTGTITESDTGMSVPGANIVEKGTSNGVMSDFDGNYSIEVPEDATLVISYIGYATLEVPVNERNDIDIILETESLSLDEVVVVGYGTQKRANLTGAVATISAEEINNRPVASAADALKGADPSLNIISGTGVLDGDHQVNIRGVVSVNGGRPLILADGVEVSLEQINPNDIESVSVLKDASSAAIYGAQASAGVILITTKSGSNTDGVARINYNGRLGFSENTTSTDFINTGYDHVSIVNEFYTVYKGKPMALYNEEEMQMLFDRRNDKTEHPDRPWTVVGEDNKYKYYGNFDWYNYFYRENRPQENHNLSISGGTEKINYFISGRLLREEGIFNIYNDNLKKYSFRAKLEVELKSWLTYSNNINYSNSNYKYAGHYDEQMTIRNLQSNTMSTFLPRNPDGSIVQYTNQLSANSPLASGHAGFLTANQARNSRQNKYLTISNQLDMDITNDILLTASHSYRYRNRFYKYRSMPFEYSRAEGEYDTFTSGSVYDYYKESFFNLDHHNVNLYGTFDKSWNNSHNFKLVAGTQYEDYRQNFVGVQQDDLLNENLSSFSIATGGIRVDQDINAYRTLGFFGRVNYDYKGKYLMELSGRMDGTSRFSPEDRWGFFPSGSVGWRMSEEDFWKPIDHVIGNSKIRFSVGSLGNQQVDEYAYFEQISADNRMSYTFDGENIANYASISNPISSTLTWETVTTYNLGLDLDFFRNKLNLTSDFYIRDTEDMLAPSLTLPSVYGASTPTANVADLRTKGWEVNLNWRNGFDLASKRFNYNVGFSIGDYSTEITKFHNPDQLISEFYVGKKLGEIWGYKVAGLFESDEAAAEYQARIDDSAVNNRVYNSNLDDYLRAGDVKFIDLNGDGVINEGSGTVGDSGDKVVIGNSLPSYSYSFRLGADWNGFSISGFFQGVGKQNWYPSQEAYDFWGPYSFPSLSFIHKDFMSNTWSEENPNAYFPRPRGYQSYSSGSLGEVNDRYLQDVSYLRLKNLTISYKVPLKTNLIDQFEIYTTGENLFYWSDLKNASKTVDPELTNTSNTYKSNTGVGYSYSKSYSLGVNIIF